MIHKKSLLLFLAVFFYCSTYSHAQLWAGILDPSRATDWSQAGIPEGIPNRTVICHNVAPSGKTDGTDMNNINIAIARCAGTGQVVQLQVGTYTITGGLVFNAVNNVVLHGAGPDKTILKFTGVNPCNGLYSDICIMGSIGWVKRYQGSATWTGNNGAAGSYSKGGNVIDVGTWRRTAPRVGDIILLDQRDDSIGICPASGGTGTCSGVSGATETGTTVTITTSIPHDYSINQCVGIGDVGGLNSTIGYNSIANSDSCGGYAGWFKITAVPSSRTFQYTAPVSSLSASGGGYVTTDTGGFFVSDVHGATIVEQSQLGRTCPDSANPACASGEISRRAQTEIKRIIAIDRHHITIDPPIKMSNWRSSQAPGVWWAGASAQLIGIENLTYDMTDDGGGHHGGINFFNAYRCWAKNVRGINASRNHVWMVQSARIQVVDSYFFGTKGRGSQSYGVEAYNASDSLLQNNICQHVVSCLMVGQDYGSVYAYNYMIDDGYRTPGWMMPLAAEHHDFAALNLFEGNDTPNLNLDAGHGTGGLQTNFRNRIAGQANPLKSNFLVAIANQGFDRAQNFVGNIIGTPGVQTTYQSTALYPPRVVWNFYPVNPGKNRISDPLIVSSSLRWGNYDVVTGAVRWCGNSSDPGWTTTCDSTSEIPTTGIRFINGNPVPSSLKLPASFYLSSQPPFWETPWGTPPWPAIGPDVRGGNAPDGVGGYSYSIPAQLCYLNMPVDPAYQQTLEVKGATWLSGTATLTIGTNTLEPYNTVVVTGVNPSGYNGSYEVTAVTPTTISYAMPKNPGAYSSGGTAAYPNIRLFNAVNCYSHLQSHP